MLAHSEQNVNCTHVSWTYGTGYAEPAPPGNSTAGQCYLKSGTARLPVGATYRSLNGGAARGVVFSSVSEAYAQESSVRPPMIWSIRLFGDECTRFIVGGTFRGCDC